MVEILYRNALVTKIFFHSDGQPSPNPTSRASARALRRYKYDDLQRCSVCSACSIKHTASTRCIHCARIDASAFYALAVIGEPWPDGKPLPAPMAEALALSPTGFPGTPGGDLWVKPDPCEKSGHLGLCNADGSCWTCSQPSPRLAAIEAGATKYVPRDPCPECRTLSPRRVDNGRCDGCTAGLTLSDLALLGLC